MMHLRVISPSSRTDEVLAVLAQHPACANVVLHRGAAIDPIGDVIIGDIARESANDILDALRGLGLEESGSIALDAVGVALSARGKEAEAAVAGDGADAVVWDEVEQRTGDDARLTVTFVLFLTIATIIAALGVLLDQPILIVGAMVVGPEFGPLAAVCVGIVQRRPRMIGRAILALAVGFGIAIAATIAATSALTELGLVTSEMLVAERPLTGFIWRPDALSWVIGFLAGIAGMMSLTSAKSGALIGVLISVTTVPAAGNIAVAIAYGAPNEAWGAAGQLGINIAAILVAGVLTLSVDRVVSALRHRPWRTRGA